jgi:hypothetical protein
MKTMNKDARITSILQKYDEDLSSTWMVQGQRVIYHSALERIAAKAGIQWDMPTWLVTGPECAVVQVSGTLHYKADEAPTSRKRMEWSVGEAHVNVNYRVSGRQQPYPYAMAEKRAKDRVILKLINLHGLLYSEEEADEFKESAAGDRREIMSDAVMSGKPVVLDDGVVHPSDALKRHVDEQCTALGVQNYMLRHDVQTYLSGIPEDQKDELRDYAKCRMVALGWGKRPND